MTTPGVVDTNVLCVAEGVPGAWPDTCVLACVRYLRELQASGSVVIDDADRILSEYAGALSAVGRGQPGVGRRFLLWLYQRRGDVAHCEVVRITPSPDDDGDFIEFPSDEALANFDRDDRKFVATAMVSSREPEVVNATDSDWWDHREALMRNGVTVRFLCHEMFVGRG